MGNQCGATPSDPYHVNLCMLSYRTTLPCLTIEPPDVPQDFLVELEFYDWWQAVKAYARRGEFHPSIHNYPRSGILGNDGNYKSVDLTGTGLPRKFERFYTKGLDYPKTIAKHTKVDMI